MGEQMDEPHGTLMGADDSLPERAAELVAQVSDGDSKEDEGGSPGRRRRRRIAPAATAVRSGVLSGARATGNTVRATRQRVSSGRGWLAAQVVAMAPRLTVRDQDALRAQFPGRDPDEIADALIEGAARASATIGGAVGAWSALPTTLPAWPAEVLTETLALVGVEIKLVAELHEAYGLPATGNVVDRMTAYVAAWAHRRGVLAVPGGIMLAAGSPLARQLRRRLAARAGRSAFSLGPLFTGAAAGALLNRRETRRLGQDIQDDLRDRATPGRATWRTAEPPPDELRRTAGELPGTAG